MIQQKVFFWVFLVFSLWALSSRASETQTTPIYDGTTTYYDDFSLNIGVQQALENQGIILNGIQYDYDVWLGADTYESYCANWFLAWCTDWRTRIDKDPFISGGVQLKDADGNIIASDTEYWTTERNWTSYSNTLNLPINGVEGYRPPNMGSFSASYELYDNVQLRDFNVNARYVYDPCYLDPLYDPKCPGYTEAFLQKQLEEQLAQQQALMEEMMEQVAPIAEEVAEEPTNEPIQEPIPVVADVVSEQTSTEQQNKKSTGLTDDQKNALSNADAQAKSAEKVASQSSDMSIESSNELNEQLTESVIGVESANKVTEQLSGISVDGSISVLSTTQTTTMQSSQMSENTQQTEQIVGEDQLSAQQSQTQQMQTTEQTSMQEMQTQETDVSVDVESAIAEFAFKVDVVESALDRVIKDNLATAEEQEEEVEEELTEQNTEESNSQEDMLVAMAQNGNMSEEAQIAMMGFNPNFRAYQQPQMPDANFYKPKEIYEGQENYDNPNQRFFNGASDVLHQQLINLQYGR
jgi:hypothetical protein